MDFGFKAPKVVRVCGISKMGFYDKTQAFCDRSIFVLS